MRWVVMNNTWHSKSMFKNYVSPFVATFLQILKEKISDNLCVEKKIKRRSQTRYRRIFVNEN